jgi:hypothetical protein
LGYDGCRFLADVASKRTLHELPELAARVREPLTDDANYGDALVALGAPFMLALSPDQAAVERAMEGLENIVHGLDTIAHAAPPPPTKHGRGRAPPTKDLRYLAGLLATNWESQTGHPFKQYWVEGKPWNAATKFVHDVVQFIAPERLSQLPEVTERLVADWRAGQRDSWWRDPQLPINS